MDIVTSTRNLALSEIQTFGLPHLTHFEIAEKKVLEITEHLHGDRSIALIGYYLMDLKLGQAFKEKRLGEHVQMSVDAARVFLAGAHLPHQTQESILNCIAAHHGDVPFTCIEAEICANADAYRFIHPTGFFAYLLVLGKWNLSFADCLMQAEQKMDEKWKILSLDLCKKELEPYYRTLKNYIADAKNL